MGYTTIRISSSAHQTLKRLASSGGKSMQSLLEDAVEALRRQSFLEELNADYASLRADADEWKKVEAERRAWDVTLADGLSASEGRAEYRATKKRKAPR
jgi:predicted transcriptional regulator